MKTEGFSLIELLSTLALASFILVLFFENLSIFSLKSFHMIRAMQAQDHAISALLLVENQVQSARVTYCAKSVADYQPYQVLTQDSLLVHHLTDTITLENASLPKAFRQDPDQLVVIDDCKHAEIVEESKLETNLADFTYPLSLSILETKTYYLGQTKDQYSPTALFVYEKDHQELIPGIARLEFTVSSDKLTILTQPSIGHDTYQLTH